MAETDKKAPRVINKSGTLKMEDKVAATKQTRDISGKRMDRRNRRDRVRADAGKKEYDSITIAVDRVSRTVAGGRRMRFKALVAIGNHKNKVGIGVAKGNDVTTAVSKAERKAKKSMITFNMDRETICHETRTKITGADVLMKPAAPGTGIIAGGTVRSIMGLTGVKNLISKSLGSTNKVNIAYAVIEGLKQQTPRNEWVNNEGKAKIRKTESVKKTEVKEPNTKKVEAKKPAAKKVETKKVETKKVETKKVETKKASTKKPAATKKATTAKKTTAKKTSAGKDK
ncbi:30S ribosomal protein S5 [Candidatus Saccharibacteria bacterium]|nr:30S ribosomal protein S5 [Candidatus Saccharibacteria bacterium]